MRRKIDIDSIIDEKVELDKTISIKILPLAYFLASKFETYHNRGTDPRTSHDLEDIVFILDNRIDLVENILSAPYNVVAFLRDKFATLLNPSMEEAVLGHMNPFSRKDRYPLLVSKLRTIISPGK